jgi:hypothetical protein
MVFQEKYKKNSIQIFLNNNYALKNLLKVMRVMDTTVKKSQNIISIQCSNQQLHHAVTALKMLIVPKVHNLGILLRFFGNFRYFFMKGVCICNKGFIGNGQDCRMICALDEMFNGVSCVKNAGPDEGNLLFFTA